MKVTSVPHLVVLDAQSGKVLVRQAARDLTLGVGDSNTGEPDVKAAAPFTCGLMHTWGCHVYTRHRAPDSACVWFARQTKEMMGLQSGLRTYLRSGQRR